MRRTDGPGCRSHDQHEFVYFCIVVSTLHEQYFNALELFYIISFLRESDKMQYAVDTNCILKEKYKREKWI